ncbi:zinc finger BED domain-containing protein 6-like [Copidosoma floridanum]|uniref:zinc finger BED domain-containing protein 6-like n=1 Tax=Copidosoma floridanum TaxID=29053 RepID=UPI0006C9D010|nr:zinc finger BED domain-containing protein 6-like [Copidosoma floridanum]
MNKSKGTTRAKSRAAPSFNEIWTKNRKLTKNIAFSVALDLFPITSPEIKRARDALRVTEPFYQFPTEKHLYEVILPRMYDQVKQKVQQTVRSDLAKGVKQIALSIDGWTGRSVSDHMSITAHYWTADFEPRHFLLQLESLPRAWNTAHDLFHLIQNVLLKYGFAGAPNDGGRVVHIVTANGHNVVEATELNPNWIRVPCLARLLQLTVDDALDHHDEFNALRTKCERLLSALWSKSGSSTGGSLLRDEVVPSWNSIHEMFDSLLRLRGAVRAFLQESPDLQLTDTDWESMERYVGTLAPLRQATEMLSGEPYPPLSLYIPTARAVFELVRSASSLDDCLADRLGGAMCSRFGRALNANESMVVAMVLDPRFKTRLLSDEERPTVVDIVRDKMLETTGTAVPRSRKRASSPLEQYLARMGDEQKPSLEKAVEAELAHYLCEDVVPMDSRINEWWRRHSRLFPRLGDLARVYLAVPAVQVSTERAFPRKRGFDLDRRAELLASQANVLDLMRISFLNHNLGYFEAEVDCL